jgi:LacI family transcriptional regulator
MSKPPPGAPGAPGGVSGAPPRATIRDVAALAGVGIKTVSRVINNEGNVSPQLRDRVESAVAVLKYQPHIGAGTLRRGDRKTYAIGLVTDSVDNPFSAAVNRAVENVAMAHNTAVFAASSDDDPARERSLIQAFTGRRVDGLVLTMTRSDHGYLQHEREQGTPIVFVDRPPNGLVADAVVTDNYEAAALATRHLLGFGHRRIAHLGDEVIIQTAVERRRGFTDAVRAAGLSEGDSTSTDNLRSEHEARRAVTQLMSMAEPPTALFTSQNLVTIGALRALRDLGLQHQVAVVGFDDIDLADLVDPPITVMAQNPQAIGTLAADRVFARLDGDTDPATTQVVPARLIVRGSGEIPPRD